MYRSEISFSLKQLGPTVVGSVDWVLRLMEISVEIVAASLQVLCFFELHNLHYSVNIY